MKCNGGDEYLEQVEGVEDDGKVHEIFDIVKTE
jgi:hypothetical protein